MENAREIGQCRPGFDQMWPEFGEFQADRVKCAPKSIEFGRIWPDEGQRCRL